MSFLSRAALLVLGVLALSAPAHGQQSYESMLAADGAPKDDGAPWWRVGGPFTFRPVLNAPFSAEATTRIRENLADGGVLDHVQHAHYYRDSQGRVRAELDTPWGQLVMLDLHAFVGPSRSYAAYILHPATRTYIGTAPAWARTWFNGEGSVALPVARNHFRHSGPVAGASAAERLQSVNAEVSPDLHLVISSHRADQMGIVDYQVTQIKRDEPSADLFEVPADYAHVPSSELAMTLQSWQNGPHSKNLTRSDGQRNSGVISAPPAPKAP